MSCSINEIKLDVSQAIPVGIILNEAVTNALKYAFPDNRTGRIMIAIKQFEQQIVMQISDDGAGLPDEFDLSKNNSLGITLIKGLTSQLKGTFSMNDSGGVTIIVKFPVEAAPIKSVIDNLTAEEV